MPDELDDFEIRTQQAQQRETERFEELPPPPERPKPRLLPAVLAALAVLALAAVAVFIFRFQPWRSRAPIAAKAAPPLAAASPSTEARRPVPPLDDSDAFARGIGASLSSHPEFARWLARTNLVRTAAAVVSNIADGETPRPHLEFLAPKQRFLATGAGRRTVADPAGFAGYDLFGDVIASLDTQATVAAYRATEPLFDAAYSELGHPEGFRVALDRAISELLAAPVPAADAELLPHAVGFRWADPKLEGLKPAQKQFLRTGPRNVRLVQAKLRELQRSLRSSGSST